MRNRTHRTNIFTNHTRNITRRIYRNGIERADEPCFLGANRYAGAAIDAGIPPDFEEDRLFAFHGQTFL